MAAVDVTRGTSTSTWAVYSTALGSPVGDTTSGSFRLSCNASQAPCAIAVKAAALSDNSGTLLFFPRLLLTQDAIGASSPTIFCEYGDGSTGAAPATLTKQPKSASPSYQAVPLNIGGTADCPGTTGPAGDVANISLPVGRYNVYAAFFFTVGGAVGFDAGD